MICPGGNGLHSQFHLARMMGLMGWGNRGVSKQGHSFETDQDTRNVEVRHDTEKHTNMQKRRGGEITTYHLLACLGETFLFVFSHPRLGIYCRKVSDEAILVKLVVIRCA